MLEYYLSRGRGGGDGEGGIGVLAAGNASSHRYRLRRGGAERVAADRSRTQIPVGVPSPDKAPDFSKAELGTFIESPPRA